MNLAPKPLKVILDINEYPAVFACSSQMKEVVIHFDRNGSISSTLRSTQIRL